MLLFGILLVFNAGILTGACLIAFLSANDW